MKARLLLVFALALFVSACGSSIAPSPEISLPIALAGQSNALFIRPYLIAAVAPEVVTGFAQDGSTIAQWAVTAPQGYWSQLAPSLHQPLKAFVWWQGESDTTNVSTYLNSLTEFIARVRNEAHDPTLRVVICRVVDDPAFSQIRALQAAYVAADARSVLVSSDGLPTEFSTPGSAHLSPEGYQQMAQRIAAVLR